MSQALRTAWNANRHWLAAGFLASTSLFLLSIFVNWRNEHRGITEQRATGLAAVSVDSASLRQQKSIIPSSYHKPQGRAGLDYIGGTLGGVPGGVARAEVDTSRLAPPSDNTERQVIRTGTLEITATDPLQAAEQLRNLATHLSGFVVSSKVSGSDERTRSAQVTMRIHFDDARAQVRRVARTRISTYMLIVLDLVHLLLASSPRLIAVEIAPEAIE